MRSISEFQPTCIFQRWERRLIAIKQPRFPTDLKNSRLCVKNIAIFTLQRTNVWVQGRNTGNAVVNKLVTTSNRLDPTVTRVRKAVSAHVGRY